MNTFFFKAVKTKSIKERLEKPKEEKLLLLIPESISDRKLSACKTLKYQLNIEKKVECVSRIKCFRLSILHISFNSNCRIVQRKTLLINSTLITSHLTIA